MLVCLSLVLYPASMAIVYVAQALTGELVYCIAFRSIYAQCKKSTFCKSLRMGRYAPDLYYQGARCIAVRHWTFLKSCMYVVCLMYAAQYIRRLLIRLPGPSIEKSVNMPALKEKYSKKQVYMKEEGMCCR